MSEKQTLSYTQQEKLTIIRSTLSGLRTISQAAIMLGISSRQMKRLKKKVRENGESAVVHQLKGRKSNHQLSLDLRQTTIAIVKKHYADFTPQLASEKLEQIHQICINPQTLRRWMIVADLWKQRKQKQTVYRAFRSRKEYFGELQQFDGSYHLWFEDRFVDANGTPIEVCLLASIDDASGEITKAQFAANEGVLAVFTFWKEYVLEIGKTLAIYLDKFSTYKINHKAAVDNSDLITQFQRVMQQLGTKLISANSPEAKGRVERLFQTLQDRLVKEMRLAKIMTPKEGNVFLEKIFIPAFNKKFTVVPTKEGNVHKPLLQEEKKQIHHVFSIHDTRRINLDFTIQFKNNWYQLTEIQPTTIHPLLLVLMETWLDGSVHIMLKDHELAYIHLPEKPKKQRMKQPLILTTHTLNYKPPPNHPWRRYAKGSY